MLRDIERKVLAILHNFSAMQKRLPTLKELSVKTGKHENEVRFILNKLQGWHSNRSSGAIRIRVREWFFIL